MIESFIQCCSQLNEIDFIFLKVVNIVIHMPESIEMQKEGKRSDTVLILKGMGILLPIIQLHFFL